MSTSLEYRYSCLITSRWTQLRMRKFREKFLDRIKNLFVPNNFFPENRAVCVMLCKIMYARQATVRFACGITEGTHCHRICNNYCFPITTMVTRKQCTVTLYVTLYLWLKPHKHPQPNGWLQCNTPQFKIHGRSRDWQQNKLPGHHHPQEPDELEDIHIQENNFHWHYHPIHFKPPGPTQIRCNKVSIQQTKHL